MQEKESIDYSNDIFKEVDTMVMMRLSEHSKAKMKKKAVALLEKKTVKYADEPKMTSTNPAKEPKNKPKYK